MAGQFVTEVSDASFEKRSCNRKHLYLWIFGPLGAVPVVRLPLWSMKLRTLIMASSRS